jgi:hypothetical protein
MTTINTELLGKLNGTVESLNQSIIKIDKSLFGNGQPGAMERITRIEENIEDLAKTTQESREYTSQAIDKLTLQISELKDIVKKHHEDKSLHTFLGLTLRKEIVIWSLVGFTALHSLVSLLPDISVFIKLLLGLVGIKI